MPCLKVPRIPSSFGLNVVSSLKRPSGTVLTRNEQLSSQSTPNEWKKGASLTTLSPIVASPHKKRTYLGNLYLKKTNVLLEHHPLSFLILRKE